MVQSSCLLQIQAYRSHLRPFFVVCAFFHRHDGKRWRWILLRATADKRRWRWRSAVRQASEGTSGGPAN
ncbi:hypothetical protein L1987_23627 [Smallanthus sonchifolius]|uniref:Uncharacterized protein n=1 Tax=Smallanthus sonchifolius TaxID=185202 RepID=A0ACB9IJI6_9ASTR|nr:hypothetical protein L1987_23627 [Smallanthus sonchifolius]